MPVVLLSSVSKLTRWFEILSMGQVSSGHLSRVEGCLLALEWPPRMSLGCETQPPARGCPLAPKESEGGLGVLPLL